MFVIFIFFAPCFYPKREAIEKLVRQNLEISCFKYIYKVNWMMFL